MLYMDIGCDTLCYKCNKECDIKTLMQFSIMFPALENKFYYEIMNFLKSQAGLLITQGANPIDVQKEFNILAVSFYVARKIMSEQV